MAKGRKKADKETAKKSSRNGVAYQASKGKGARLDEKLARAISKKVKKLRRDLVDAARVEAKRVRALDKAHRRRQLIQSALEELSGAALESQVASEASRPPAASTAGAQPETVDPAETKPATATRPVAASRRPSARRAKPQA